MAFPASVLDVDARRFVTTADGNRHRGVAGGGWIVSWNVDIKTIRTELYQTHLYRRLDDILTWQETINSVDAAVICFRYSAATNSESIDKS